MVLDNQVLWGLIIAGVVGPLTLFIWVVKEITGGPLPWRRDAPVHAPVPGTDICRACGAIHPWAPGVVDGLREGRHQRW